MLYINKELEKGIKIHYIKTKKFKTNIIAIYLTVPLLKETVTFNALLPNVLKLGNNKLGTQTKLFETLENMYGARFWSSIEKIGNNQILKFYIETINDKYINLLENIEDKYENNLLKEAINILLDIIFNPLIEKGSFKNEYVELEKKKLEEQIKSKIDDKESYAIQRCIEEMYKGTKDNYALYNWGDIKDIEKINSQNLYEEYINIRKTAKIDIIISRRYK